MNATVRWISHNKLLTTGGFIIGVLLLISLIGPHIIDEQDIKIGYAPPDQPPSWEYPLGTDTSGRQMLPTILYGTPLTLRVGIIAGALGTAIGVTLAFISGFYRGLPGRNNPQCVGHVANRSGPAIARRRGVHPVGRFDGEPGGPVVGSPYLDGADAGS